MCLMVQDESNFPSVGTSIQFPAMLLRFSKSTAITMSDPSKMHKFGGFITQPVPFLKSLSNIAGHYLVEKKDLNFLR